MAKQPAKDAKRRVKNPETFRERAIKAADEGDKPKRTAQLKRASGQVTGPIGRVSNKVAGFKLLQPLRRPLRLIGKVLVPTYVRKSWQELRQVEWPSWRQSLRLTRAVLIFATIFGVIVAGVDYGLDKFFRGVILK